MNFILFIQVIIMIPEMISDSQVSNLFNLFQNMIKALCLLGLFSLCTLLLVQVYREIIIMEIQVPGFGKIYSANTSKITTTETTFQIEHFNVIQKQKYEKFYQQKKTEPVSYSILGKKIQISSGSQKYIVSKYPFPNNIRKIQKVSSQNIDIHSYIFWHSTFHTLYYAQEKNPQELHSCLTIQHEKSNNQNNYYFAIDSNNIGIFSLVMERVLLIQIYSCSSKKIIQKMKIPFKRQITQQMNTTTGGYHKFQQMLVQLGLLQQEAKLSVKVSLLSISTDFASLDIKFISTANGQHKIVVSDLKWSRSYEIKNNANQLLYKLHYPADVIASFYKTTLTKFFADLLGQLMQIYKGDFKSEEVIITHQKVAQALIAKHNEPRVTRQQRLSFIAQYQSQDSLIYLLGNQGLNKTSTVLKLGKHMNSIQTPIFYNTDSPKASKKNTQVIERYLSPDITIQQFKKFSLFEYKYFQFKQKAHEELTQQPNIEDQLQIKHISGYTTIPLYPIAQTFWYTLTSTGGNFIYPTANMKEKQFKYIRTSTGAVILEGYKFKGKYDNLPRIQGQVYMRISDKTNIMYLPNIYPAHLIYKHLISYPKLQKKSPCLQLINGLAGKSILTHYLFPKDKFQLTKVYLQNNQWIISEYDVENKQTQLSKYQIFFNNSNVKQILYVKRTYAFPDIRIHSISKCIDGFYYMEVQTQQGTLGFMRIAHQALNNRRANPTTKFSGMFDKQISFSGQEQYRQSKLKPKKRDFPIGIQQYYFDIFQNERNIYIQTNVMYQKSKEEQQNLLKPIRPAFQYDILPYSVYQSKKTENIDSFYIFNVRRLWIESTLIKIKQIQREVILGIGMTALFFWSIAFALLVNLKLRSKTQKQNTEKKIAEKDQKKEDKPKNQSQISQKQSSSSPSFKSSKNKKKKSQ